MPVAVLLVKGHVDGVLRQGYVQIAEKFLERPELANMSFQNDFLKPFVVVMRQSGAKEIRELIIRQVSRMVLLQVGNVKSGWKSMFMVCTHRLHGVATCSAVPVHLPVRASLCHG